MPSPPVILLCAAGLGLATILYYFFVVKEESPSVNYMTASEGSRRSAKYSEGSRRSSKSASNCRENRYEAEECSICQEPMYNPSSGRFLSCGHLFHSRCINKWFESAPVPRSCPNCRRPC